MRNSTFFAFSLAVLSFAACTNEITQEVVLSDVRVEPVITRALSLNFNDGDKIGLDIIKSDGVAYAENACLTYSGTSFAGNLKWYSDGAQACALRAYYPYMESGFPDKFSVQLDQTGGTESSDLMVASKAEVYPSASAEMMVFRHQFSQIVVNIDNKAQVKVAGVTIKGLVPSALLSRDENGAVTVMVDTDASSEDIMAEMLVRNQKYCFVVVPQEFHNMGIILDMEGASAIITGVDGAELKAGYSYTVNISISADQVNVSIGGEIGDWENGGDLGGGGSYEPSFEEYDGGFTYDGVSYTTAVMKDGKTWMTQNMRYLPAGMTPCNTLSNVKGGVYLPLRVNESNTGLELSDDEEVIASNGYLYQNETALGVAVGSVKTVEDLQALEGARGICPNGWHVPTIKDIVGLVGKVGSYTYVEGESAENAPYYDKNKANALASLLNEDGFNAYAWGAVTVPDFTSTEAKTMGWIASNPSSISSGYLCGSSYAKVAYNTKDDPSSGIKNFQVWALMPFVSMGYYNGALLNIRTAAPLRCVKD